MTLSERRNYEIAIGLSILLHAALLFVVLPEKLFLGPGNEVEMLSAGLVDFNPGARNSEVSLNDSPSESGTTEKILTPPAPERVITAPKEKPQPAVKLKRQPKKLFKEEPVKTEADDLKVQVSKKAKEQPDNVQNHQSNAKKEKPISATVKPLPEHSTVKAANGKPGGNGEGSGEGTDGKTGKVPQGLGSGANMVASGLDVQYYYPKNALNESKEGDVKFRVLIGRDGSLEKIDTLQLSGDTRLDKAALNIVQRNIKFKPFKEKYLIDMIVIFKIANEVPIVKYLNAETRL
jgi:TonB family protein